EGVDGWGKVSELGAGGVCSRELPKTIHCLTRLRSPLAEKTGKVLGEFCRCYAEQYGVALFNSVRYEIEGNGGPQAQLLHRKVPLEDHVIYSGNLFQYIEENKKWRNRFCVVPHNYGLELYENKLAYERDLSPRILVNSAGYKILTSVDQYLELVNSSLPGVTPKSGHTPILKCPTDFPLILWHPYARHYYFCVMTGKEQEKWRAVFQDCVRHCNNEPTALAGLSQGQVTLVGRILMGQIQ
ncbi:PREDICTED: niban-like protein 1, partial [Tauraco erythrolophus]|uniref:niban-like protein 1 n=1 Tax=Tauraco erythrolophus TaxID=121530 RepID=UPI0005236CA6